MTVDHESAVPVYRQVAAILREAIQRGDYRPGRPIPSETRLADEWGISRLTVRKGVRVLVDEGLVHVVQGRGTYVTECDC
ncbi:MAG: GntR family transcriptional regulator [Streptosporangiaceae bacterium]